MRKRLFSIIEVTDGENRLSYAYDLLMMICIVLSLIPLALKEVPPVFSVIDAIVTVIFVIDYLLRLVTADLKLGRGALSFLIYPFTFMAIIDLLSVLPSLLLLSEALRVLKAVRFLRALRVLKIFKSFRYSKNIAMIASVFREQRKSLITVCVFSCGYILVSALAVFNVEPDTFNTFFDALYWATVSLTTVGYGDIYTVSTLGRVITMVSSVLGVAVVALPAGIVTAGYMKALEEVEREERAEREAREALALQERAENAQQNTGTEEK